MDIRFATSEEEKNWNARVLSNPDNGNIFQGVEFAEQKKLSGWTPRYVIADKTAVTVLEKRVSGLGKMWYIPKGPGISNPVELADMLPNMKKFARKHVVFAVKMEPELEKSDDALKLFSELGLVSVPAIQQNVSTVLVDLSPDLDTILANLNQKGRHAIRRAERDGAKVKRVESNDNNFQIFYELFKETAQGQKFVIRPYEYYRDFWQRYADAGMGQMFFAYDSKKVVACAYAMVFGEKSTYKDGASVREKTIYGASHYLQWEVIKWAKEQGSKIHDLCGAPPSDSINDESHPYYGFGRFKTSFNKQVTDYVGAYDLVVKSGSYKLWMKIGEKVTKRLWWEKHRESWY